jgi:hypothetical protein
MLEPGNMIRTYEAYRTLRDRLKPGGVLAIWYPAGLDGRLILTDQYVRTLRALDLETIAYEAVERKPSEERPGRPIEYLILAGRKPEGEPMRPFPRALERLPDLKGAKDPARDFQRVLDAFFVAPKGSGPRTAGIPEYPEAFPAELPVLMDPLFTPIPDEKPFLAGNVRHILSTEQVYALFAAMGVTLLFAAAAVTASLRRRGNPGIPGRSYAKVAGLSALIGANFLLAEHYLVLALFRKLFVYHDSLMLGAIAFLVLSGMGSLLVAGRLRVALQALGAASLLALLAFQCRPAGIGWDPGAPWVFALFAPAALITGSFFPAIFDLAARNPLGVFALDAVGAAFGSLAAFLIPILFGFQTFFVVAAVVMVATVISSALFHHRLPGKPEPQNVAER